MTTTFLLSVLSPSTLQAVLADIQSHPSDKHLAPHLTEAARQVKIAVNTDKNCSSVTKVPEGDELGIRVVEAVRNNLAYDPRVIGIIEYEKLDHNDYWERIYIVAWKRSTWTGRNCGTHRVNIDSKGDSMLVSGHFDLTEEAALTDMYQRAGKKQPQLDHLKQS